MPITVVFRKVDLGELRVELEKFEVRYGVSSERMAEVFTDERGVFHETEEWADWDALFTMVKRTPAPPS